MANRTSTFGQYRSSLFFHNNIILTINESVGCGVNKENGRCHLSLDCRLRKVLCVSGFHTLQISQELQNKVCKSIFTTFMYWFGFYCVSFLYYMNLGILFKQKYLNICQRILLWKNLIHDNSRNFWVKWNLNRTFLRQIILDGILYFLW